MSPNTNIIALLMRRDLRVSDHPVFHHLSTSPGHGFTHLVPIYTFPPNQVEVSGFIAEGTKSPYPEARSALGGYWRCGPHRAKFLAESVWNIKGSLEELGSGLAIRVGAYKDIVQDLVSALKAHDHTLGAVWMVGHEGTEEEGDQEAVAALCEAERVGFRLWTDEKYYIDDRDIGMESPQELPDIFTTYRKSSEPLRERPRAVLPTPTRGSLPPFLDGPWATAQKPPFEIPKTLEGLLDALVKPVRNFLSTSNVPEFPESAESAHPFLGGETAAQDRLNHLIKSEGMRNYKDTRNGLIGTEFSTKLSAYLAQGCVTSRQIHHALLGYEDGTNESFKEVDGFGAGENEGTAAIRFELLWRDYMRLCHQKFKDKLFRLHGFKSDQAEYKDEEKKPKWKFPTKERAGKDQDPSPERIAEIIARFNAGTTGMGLIDAAQRELLHTGYTSNRARQNVASFLSKHLDIDWRYGAEWYEMLLVDYDVSSNWANWQYVAGVGNDPRGELRIFNPIKQAFDYDKDGKYVRSWVPEVSKLDKLQNVFQACTASEDDIRSAGLEGNIMVTDPVKRIQFSVERKPPRPNKQPFFRRKAQEAQRSRAAAGGSEGNPPGAGGSNDAGESQGQPGTGGNVASENGDQTAGSRAPANANRGGGEGSRGRGGRGGRSGYRGQQRGYHRGGRGGPGRGRGGGRGGGGFTPPPHAPHAGRGHGQWEQAQAPPPQSDA